MTKKLFRDKLELRALSLPVHLKRKFLKKYVGKSFYDTTATIDQKIKWCCYNKVEAYLENINNVSWNKLKELDADINKLLHSV